MLLQGSGTLSDEQLQNGLTIVGAVVQASVDSYGKGNPKERRVNAILDGGYLSDYGGKSYAEVLDIIAHQTPPLNDQKET